MEMTDICHGGADATGSKTLLGAISKYDIPLNEEVIVAVFDSGLQKNHPFFDASRIIDSEINVSSSATELNKNDTNDNYGHGTHVAGIIYNNTPSNVKISPYKVAENDKGFDYLQIAELIPKAVTAGADVINMSFETPVFYEIEEYITFKNNVNDATQSGVIVVAAAGNHQQDASRILPAYLENAITVSAITESNMPWKVTPGVMGSNYGDCVDIAAPGINIISTGLNNSKNVRMDGTSQAAPFVSAAAAIMKLLDTNASLTAYRIKEILKETAYRPSGWDDKYGTGIVNFLNMVKHFERLQSPIINNVDNKIEIANNPLSNQDADIYYSTNGSFPDPSSANLYNQPISISDPNVKTITAVSFSDGILFSEPSSYIVRWTKTYSELRYKSSVYLTVPDQNVNVLKWTSDNSDIVSVNDNGKITGIKRGTATITASIEGGRSATYEVKVIYSFWQWLIVIFLFGWAWY